MKLLYPEFLFGLFALAIPVIIHLFNFRKAKKVYFSNTTFLKQIKTESKRKQKLKHLLILAARLLFIAFLVLAFAHPYIPTNQDQPLSRQVIIYLDNSYSMSSKNSEGFTLMEKAIQMIDEITKSYPRGTSFRLISNDAHSMASPSITKEQLGEELTEIRLSYVSRPLSSIIKRIEGITARSQDHEDIYLISDFQRSTFGDVKITDSLSNIFILPLQPTEVKNVYVDSVYLSSPFFIPEQTNTLNVVLHNSGEQDIDDMMVRLYIDSIQNASASIDIPAGSRGEIQFDLRFDLLKFNAGRISFEDFPITFDNDFYFALKLESPLSILEISGSDNKVIEKVFGNKKLFHLTSQPIGNLDYRMIEGSDMVVVHSIKEIPNSVQKALKSFIQSGKVLLYIPSGEFKPGFLESLNIPVTAYMGNAKTGILVPDFKNPFFEDIFSAGEGNFLMPDALPVFYMKGGQQLLKLKNEVPFLAQFGKDKNVYVLASPLVEANTNFHQHALFVPVMYKVAASARRGGKELFYSINEPFIRLKLDSIKSGDILKLKKKEAELIPIQRIVGAEWIGELPSYSIAPGYYYLTYQGQDLDLLAFNNGKEESQLGTFSKDELLENFSLSKNVSIFDGEKEGSISQGLEERTLGKSFWKQALLLAICFLLAEVLLIRYFK